MHDSGAALHAFRRPRWWLGIWLCALAATLLICLLPMPAIALQIDDTDKLAHTLGHAALAAYAVMLFAPLRAVWLALAGLLVFGVAIELLQTLVPWRSGGDPLDMLANAIGTALGACMRLTPLRGALQWADTIAFRAR